MERLLFLVASLLTVTSWILLWEHRSESVPFSTQFLAIMVGGLLLIISMIAVNLRYDDFVTRVHSILHKANGLSLRLALVALPIVLSVAGFQVMNARIADVAPSRLLLLTAGVLFSLYLFLLSDGLLGTKVLLYEPNKLNRQMSISWSELAPLLVIILIGFLLRVINLNNPMDCDESYTAVYYAISMVEPWITYDTPNNHIIHSFFVYLSTVLIGGGEPAIRLPALGFSVAAIPATYVVGRSLSGHLLGLVTCIPLATSTWMVHFGYNARGYSATVFLSLMTALFFWDWLRKESDSSRRFYLLSIIMLMATLPTSVYFFLSMLVLSALVTIGLLPTRASRIDIWKSQLVVVVWTTLIYLNPVLNRIVRGLGPYPGEWGESEISKLLAEVASQTFAIPGADSGSAYVRILLVIGSLLTLIIVVMRFISINLGTVHTIGSKVAKDRKWNQTLLLITIILVCMLLPIIVLTIQGVVLSLPYARNLLYLAPLIFLVALWGWTRLFSLVLNKVGADRLTTCTIYRRARSFAGLFLALLVLIIYLPAIRAELLEPNNRTTKSAAWMSEELASYLQGTVQPNDLVKVVGGCIEPRLSYYLRDSTLLAQLDRRYVCTVDSDRTPVVFVPTWDVTQERFEKCNPNLSRTELVFDSEAVKAWRYEPSLETQ